MQMYDIMFILRLALQKSVRMFVTANPSTVALYGRKLFEYQDFLAKDLTEGHSVKDLPHLCLTNNVK